jgi:hypothetical protein
VNQTRIAKTIIWTMRVALMLMYVPQARIKPSRRRGTGFAGPLAAPP